MFDLFSRPNKFHHLLLIQLALVSLLFSNEGSTVIEPDHENIKYVGRIDFEEAKAPYLTWPGTYLEANFTGDSLSIILDDDRGENYFNVILNGNSEQPLVIACQKGQHTYEVGYGLDDGNHHVKIYKRTEGEEGGTRFGGLILGADEKLLDPPASQSRRIEIYGDSITSGMGNEAADNNPDDLKSEKNQFMSYSGIVARNLNAEAHVISKSGIGIMISWFDFIMPEYFDQLTAESNNDSKWDFSSWTPDVVVINLFQNDSWLIDNEKRLQPDPSDAQIIQAYQRFVESIQQKYPTDTLFVCALGSMDATRENSPWPGYVLSAIERIQNENPKTRIKHCFFDFTGYKQHPRVHQHINNAEKLTQIIQKEMDW